MAVNPNPDAWRPIEAFAAGQGMRIEEVRGRIESGALNGALLQSRWYVICSMIELKISDPTRPHRAFLRIHAACENGVFSAGFGRHELRLKYEHEEVLTAIGKLTTPEAEKSSSPVEIFLSGRTIRLSRSLYGDMLGVLSEWQIEVEHRDTLKQYQPEPGSGVT